MKINKGEQGYINYTKRINLIYSLLGIFLSISLYYTGYIIFNTNANFLTFISVLIVLPTSLYITKYLLFTKYKSVPIHIINKIKTFSNDATVLFDLLIARNKETILIEVAVINDNDLMLLARNAKKDIVNINNSIDNMLKSKGYNCNIKVFSTEEELINVLHITNSWSNNDELTRILLLNSI